MQALICALQTAMHGGDASGNVLAAQTIDEERKPSCAHAQRVDRMEASRRRRSSSSLLVAAVDGIAQTVQNGLRRKPSIALSRMHQMEMSGTLHAGSE